MKNSPHKGQSVLYRAIGGSEYAAMVTEVRAEGCSLIIFQPKSEPSHVSRIPFIAHHQDSDKWPVCYPLIGYEPVRK